VAWARACAAIVLAAAAGEAQAWAPGWDQGATIKAVLKYRHLFNPARNGFEASLGPGEQPPHSTFDFYRGATCDGEAPYGGWNPSGVNHVTMTYDPLAGTIRARVDAQYPYCLSYQVGDLGPLNYLQLDLRGQVAGEVSEVVSFVNVTLDGSPLGDAVGTAAPASWSVSGVELTGGFTIAGDMVLTWPPSGTGCDECSRLVLRAGWAPLPEPSPEPASAPAGSPAVWTMGLALLCALGLGGLRRG
jgi:hypothetical protein